MVFHLKKVSSKNSNQIKSYGTFNMGYKWRHLLPVYLVLEGFQDITAVSKGCMHSCTKGGVCQYASPSLDQKVIVVMMTSYKVTVTSLTTITSSALCTAMTIAHDSFVPKGDVAIWFYLAFICLHVASVSLIRFYL